MASRLLRTFLFNLPLPHLLVLADVYNLPMIVYGDPQYKEDLSTLIEQLRQRLQKLTQQGDTPGRLEQIRVALIMSGQVEQGVWDSDSPDGEDGNLYRNVLRGATALLAASFYGEWARQNDVTMEREVGSILDLPFALSALQGLPEASGRDVTIKLPEGFAFYTLYPEQYCAAALKWLREHEGEQSRSAVVVGIRSIGTTLAAVVGATMYAHNWDAATFTVRPAGHPFQREVQIAPGQVAGAEWGLVVDEGPGLSGSSMSAVGEALVQAGLQRERISFFPAHANGPGSAASDNVKAWWSSAPSYVVPLEELRFGGQSLQDSLVSWRTSQDESDPATSIEYAGGGEWRRLHYEDDSRWPAACAPFERAKYICTRSSGKRVLFKFEGLCGAPGSGLSMAEAAEHQIEERTQAGWTVAPLGVVHGFVATPWIEGTPFDLESTSEDVLQHIGRYIAAVSGPELSEDEDEAAIARLAEMLYWNTWESLGEEVAQNTRKWSEKLQAAGYRARSYGDGRMAPHEWVRTPEGTILKTDSTGHIWDHTCVGPQPVAWDLAGACVEWSLNEEATATLLEAFYSAGGETVPASAFTFYRLAYAAFRAGQCHLCATISQDPQEQARLWAAYTYYKDALARLL